MFSLLFAVMALVTSCVSHLRIQDYQRRAFDQECRLAELSVTDTLTGARSGSDFLQQAEKAAGDAMLRGMAEILQKALRDSDVFGRLGGEEFCVLLPDQGEDKARMLAAVPRADGPLTVSAGIAGLRSGESVAQTLHRTDLAMLKAKQAGRDTVCVAE